jgi:hypothetical protein
MSILNWRRDFLIGNFQGEMKNNEPETRQQTFKEGIINGKWKWRGYRVSYPEHKDFHTGDPR